MDWRTVHHTTALHQVAAAHAGTPMCADAPVQNNTIWRCTRTAVNSSGVIERQRFANVLLRMQAPLCVPTRPSRTTQSGGALARP
jgi:hypothetical protein